MSGKSVLAARDDDNDDNNSNDKTESYQENETHKILGDFDIQTDCRISARRSELVIISKKKKKKKKEKKKVKEKRTFAVTE